MVSHWCVVPTFCSNEGITEWKSCWSLPFVVDIHEATMSAWITPLKIFWLCSIIMMYLHCTTLLERSFSQIDTWWDRRNLGTNSHGKITWKRKKYHNWCQTLQWRHNGRDDVSNYQPYDDLLNGLFRHRSMETSKLRVTCLCEGNSPVTGEFPAQRASSAENVSIWWRHHGWLIVGDVILAAIPMELQLLTYVLWRLQTETFSALLFLCVGSPPVTDGFPSQRDSDADLWCSFVVSYSERTVGQTLDWQVIRDAMTDTWRRSNGL